MVARDLDAMFDPLASPLGTALGLHYQSIGLLGVLDVGTKTLPSRSVEKITVIKAVNWIG